MEHFRQAGHEIPHGPLDITQKKCQRVCRDTVLKAVEELFEAISELKNWKPHRKSEVKEFNREKMLEEYCDSFAYQLEFLILMGVTPTEFVEAYKKKMNIVHQRIDDGY